MRRLCSLLAAFSDNSATQRLPEANIVVNLACHHGALNFDFKADNLEPYFLRASLLAVVYG